MQRSAVILSLVLAAAAGAARPATPNHSIAPQRILPTPYGERLMRVGDLEQGTRRRDAPTPGAPPQEEQALEPGAQDPSIKQHLASVSSAEISGGAYTAELVEPLLDTGRAYQAQDKQVQAMAFFQRALHVSRVNEGLYSAQQLPVLQAMIASQLALGQLAAADQTHHYLYRVQQHIYAPGDPALAAATLEYTEWQRQLYLAGLDDTTYLRLLKIHSLHTRDIQRLEAEDETDPSVIPHLYQRINAEYLLSDYEGEKEPHFQANFSGGFQAGPPITTDLRRQEFRMIKKNNFRNGRKTLQRVVRLLEAQQPPDMEAIARAKVALGDWYLWWDWRAQALRSYEEAYELFASDDNSLTNPQALFTEPVELPEEPLFHQDLVTPTLRSPARARVSITVTRLGRVQDIEILELEPEDAMGARVTLFEMLRQARFRPRLRDGEVVAANSVEREYEFDY